MRALQQEHLSQEVEDDSIKEIPDNIDFNQGHIGGTDETDRQSNATPQEILQANATHAQSSEDSRPLSPLNEANGNAASQSEDSRPFSPLNIIAGPSSEGSRPLSPLKQGEATPQNFLQAGASLSSEDSRPHSPLKPAIPAKPNLAILAARRLSQASQQAPVQPENEETTFPSDSQNVVLSSDAQKQKESLEQNEDDRDEILIAQSTPLTSMEALTDR